MNPILMLEYAKWFPNMKAKYLTTTTIIITIFFGLNINLLSSLCIIIKIHISSKPLIMVTKKKYHNVNGNYNHKILDFDKKKKNTIIWLVILILVIKEVLG